MLLAACHDQRLEWNTIEGGEDVSSGSAAEGHDCGLQFSLMMFLSIYLQSNLAYSRSRTSLCRIRVVLFIVELNYTSLDLLCRTS